MTDVLQKLKSIKNINSPPIDLFASQPTLTASGKSAIKSLFGFVLSVLVAVLGIWLFFYLGKDLFNKSNPIISQYTLPFAGLKTPLNLTPHDTVFKFGILDQLTSNYNSDPSYLSVRGFLYIAANEKLGIKQDTVELDYELCDGPTDRQSLYCFTPYKYKKNNTAIVLGENGDSIVFEFSYCKPPKVCQADSDIDDFLNDALLVTKHYGYALDPDSYENAFEKVLDPNEFPLEANSKLRVFQKLSKVELFSKDGWILTSSRNESHVVVKDALTKSATFDSTAKAFATIEFDRYPDREVTFRQYPQIQDVLASVTGVVSSVLLILGIIVVPYTSFKQQEFFIRNNFRMGRKKDQTPPAVIAVPDSASIPLTKTQPMSPDHKVAPSPYLANEGKADKEDKEIGGNKEILEDSDAIRINFWTWLVSFFKEKSIVKSMRQRYDRMAELLDMMALVKLTRNMEYLTQICLSDDQKILFENLKDPLLFVDQNENLVSALTMANVEKNKKKKKETENQTDADAKKEAVKNALNRVKGKDKPHRIDTKLIELYETLG